ncbi:S8 family serine peptidase [Deinococcus sedimenti]|uniref:Peptidase S8/S53 domain-containing protein n=1 Tax=Deinococcus sedimenti TaxID=1867090 RepID=A0ABQ2S675_9DEIO|nr:S8 family serine peptidase [Deinococcus sedimenti]GGR92272.1 hypothetical protein GCM10008960_18910 [Deinococcus sedimenti]
MRRSLTCAALTLSLLSACSTSPVPAPSAARPATLVTVPVTPTTTDADLARRYGGTVEARTATFAVIGNPTAAPLAASGLKAERNERRVSVPDSETHASGDKIWATGITAWASGDKIWATSLRNFGEHIGNGWDGNRFTVFPQNSQEFLAIGVRDAQLSSRYHGDPVIAVIDGPMDTAHPALSESLVNSNNWYDFASDDASPTVTGASGTGAAYGHATAVAGVALQVAPKSRILPVQVLAEDGSGYVLDLVQGIIWAADHGADVLNLSVGTDTDSPALRSALDYAQSRGVEIAAAAGNSGAAQLDYPAAYLAATGSGVAVGSVTAQGQPSSFSATGPRMLFAPGEGLRSLYPAGREASWSGTSFSTPIAAAALAMQLSESGTPANHYARLFSLGTAITPAHSDWKSLDLHNLLD